MDCHRPNRSRGQGKRGREGDSEMRGRGRRTDRRVRGNLDESTREDEETTRRHEEEHYRADRSAVGLAHYNFYDWSFGPLGALTRMPTCKGRITAETGLSAEVSVAFKSGESARYRRSELICAELCARTLEILYFERQEWSILLCDSKMEGRIKRLNLYCAKYAAYIWNTYISFIHFKSDTTQRIKFLGKKEKLYLNLTENY